MEFQGFSYQVTVHINLSRDEVAALIESSKNHYDSRCRGLSGDPAKKNPSSYSSFGLLTRLWNMMEFLGEDSACLYLTNRNFQTILKSLETSSTNQRLKSQLQSAFYLLQERERGLMRSPN